MPLELIVISLMRKSKWITVLMLSSQTNEADKTEESSRRIDVCANGIRWIERDFEQFTPLDKFFEINTSPDSGITVDKDTDNVTALKLSVLQINDEALDKYTVEVTTVGLRLLRNEAITASFHCTKCFNELVPLRCFSGNKPMPICTMEPQKYFCPGGKLPKLMRDDELYYALNYIVISPRTLGKVCFNREFIHCSRCLQLVGRCIGMVGVQLYMDTLWVCQINEEGVELPQRAVEELFTPLTVAQMMLLLLHDAVPISEEKTRLFLKTVRQDGQLHYMLLVIDTSQVHLLRSKVSLVKDLTSSGVIPIHHANKGDESDDSTDSGTSNTSSSSETTTDSNFGFSEFSEEEEAKPKPYQRTETTPVHRVELRGIKGCRINYQIFCCDEELAANHDLIEQWRMEGTPMLRISYTMMMDLLHELNDNELLVASLERMTPRKKEGRVSYVMFEPAK